MSGAYGADTVQLRDLASTFDQSANRLDAGRISVANRIRLRLWVGPLAVRFRLNWDSQFSKMLHASAESLRIAARTLRDQASEQERASAASDSAGGNPGNKVADWFADRWKDVLSGEKAAVHWVSERGAEVWNAATDAIDWAGDRLAAGWDASVAGVQWVGDRLEDGWNWVVDRGDAIVDDWANAGDAAGQYWNATVGSLANGEWPRTTEVLASLIRLSGATRGAMATTISLGILPANVFDDGDPVAGNPETVEGATPDSLASVLATVSSAYGDNDGRIRVTTVDTPQGPRVIVSVPGTESWIPGAGNNPMDLTGNLVTAGGGRSTMSQAVELALAKANLPAGAQVMLVGHSQGGMTVADLASDSRFVSKYHVTNMVTYGSPIDSAHIDPRVNVLEFQHQSDVVPRLDLGDARLSPLGLSPGDPDVGSANHHNVTLSDPAWAPDAIKNHDHNQYRASVERSTDPTLRAYEEQLRQKGFLSPDSSSTTQAIQISRRD